MHWKQGWFSLVWILNLSIKIKITQMTGDDSANGAQIYFV